MNFSDPASRLNAYRFDLPEALIAQVPVERRTASRLLRVTRGVGVRSEAAFADLPDLLSPGDLLVVNDSRVLNARLRLRRDPGGGRVELLLVRPRAEGDWLAMARPVRRLRPGSRLVSEGESGRTIRMDVVEVIGDGYVTVRVVDGSMTELAARRGETPLPPYIKRDVDDSRSAALADLDRERYQTVYARDKGSVAAPTAGLHFDEALLATLAQRGIRMARVTLHVGPGTFRPPVAADIDARRLHEEYFVYAADVDAAVRETRARGGRVIAVGTTALRVLETVARLDLQVRTEAHVRWPDDDAAPPEFAGEAQRDDAGWRVSGFTRLFVLPPDRIASADGLITNFHLPGSSLLMLIAAFTGQDVWRDVYDQAIADGYRFYSYGDAMLILPDGERDEKESAP
ncbi:S-adenosylmethionine:tRNA ribosyltransferase-isomerase [bacterium]|nr:S-adenosylmethionine:tRNA ribosyltransferase-isomerase [bacterium]